MIVALVEAFAACGATEDEIADRLTIGYLAAEFVAEHLTRDALVRELTQRLHHEPTSEQLRVLGIVWSLAIGSYQ